MQIHVARQNDRNQVHIQEEELLPAKTVQLEFDMCYTELKQHTACSHLCNYQLSSVRASMRVCSIDARQRNKLKKLQLT